MKSPHLLASALPFLFVIPSARAQCVPACDTGETCCGSVCVDAALRFKFIDETSARGINPSHTSADNNNVIDGPGVAASDFDGDGWIDLFIPQASGHFDRLYRNRGPVNPGEFEEVALTTGIVTGNPSGQPSSLSALWVDFDNDGDLDLFVFNPQAPETSGASPTSANSVLRLYRNDGCTPTALTNCFTDVTEAIPGIHIERSPDNASAGGMCAADVNNDGFLDIHIAYNKTSASLLRIILLVSHAGESFEDAAPLFGSGLQENHQYWQPIFGDFNNDGWLDIQQNVDGPSDSNRVLINQKATLRPRFTDLATLSGELQDGGLTDMGITLGDFNNDGTLDVYTANVGHTALLRNDSSQAVAGGVGGVVGQVATFTEVSNTAMNGANDSGWSWGTTFFDADNDGHLDLAVTNGIDLTLVDRDDVAVFHNNPSTNLLESVGTDVGFLAVNSAPPNIGVSLIAFDPDRDGDLDLMETKSASAEQGGGPPGPLRLLQNHQCTSNNFLVVRPRMPVVNRFAIGAIVRVEAGGKTMMRIITAGTSFWGQEPAEAHFGLGSASSVDKVTVEWPSVGTDIVLVTQITSGIPLNDVLQVDLDPTQFPGAADCQVPPNGVWDPQDIANGTSQDCNLNGIPDECDIASGTSGDCDADGEPDECEANMADRDCNMNGTCDGVEIENCPGGSALCDCNNDGLPNECETNVGNQDCDADGICNATEISPGGSDDCNGNGVPDECDDDINPLDGIPDDCQNANRYISFVPTSGTPASYRIDHESPPGTWVTVGWVEQAASRFLGVVQDQPASLGSAWLSSAHVTGCEISPGNNYKIIRFDGATSTELALVATGSTWGDVNNDSAVNFADIQLVVFGFQDIVANNPLVRVDIEPCKPDGIVNFGDVLEGVRAFQGCPYRFETNPTNCPSAACCADGVTPCPTCGCCDQQAPCNIPSADPVPFTLVANPDLVQPGQPIDVDVLVGAVTNLANYQLTLEVSGGVSGALVLTDIQIDTVRSDYVFGTSSTLNADNTAEAKMGNMLMTGGTNVTTSAYLATFSFLPCQGATGTFTISLAGNKKSFLRDANGEEIDSLAANCPVIGVGIDCLTDAHCDDGNVCTIDRCVASQCNFTLRPTGFPCDDGVFCTATDTCTSLGTCVGTGSPCARGETCCEFTEECRTGTCPPP